MALDTVRFHVRAIYAKLHVHSKSEAVLAALGRDRALRSPRKWRLSTVMRRIARAGNVPHRPGAANDRWTLAAPSEPRQLRAGTEVLLPVKLARSFGGPGTAGTGAPAPSPARGQDPAAPRAPR